MNFKKKGRQTHVATVTDEDYGDFIQNIFPVVRRYADYCTGSFYGQLSRIERSLGMFRTNLYQCENVIFN